MLSIKHNWKGRNEMNELVSNAFTSHLNSFKFISNWEKETNKYYFEVQFYTGLKSLRTQNSFIHIKRFSFRCATDLADAINLFPNADTIRF